MLPPQRSRSHSGGESSKRSAGVAVCAKRRKSIAVNQRLCFAIPACRLFVCLGDLPALLAIDNGDLILYGYLGSSCERHVGLLELPITDHARFVTIWLPHVKTTGQGGRESATPVAHETIRSRRERPQKNNTVSSVRHPGEGRGPENTGMERTSDAWIPASAGMTAASPPPTARGGMPTFRSQFEVDGCLIHT
jgi:hypothetical protein